MARFPLAAWLVVGVITGCGTSAPLDEAKPPTPTPPALPLLQPRNDGPPPAPALFLAEHGLLVGQGALTRAGGGAFTLEHTKVDIAVTGFMQEVTLTQRFKNPFTAPVEAIYAFPLPEDAAVHDLTLVAGARTLKASIKRRFEARQLYEQAKAEGRRAALLDQERPNLFTQSVANLLPGETVLVTLQYVAPLKFDDGVYTLNFPMVVGPRYVPGVPLPGASEGVGTSPDTLDVSDASRITPPVARSGRDVEVTVRLEAGTVIEDLWSVSHALRVDRASAQRATLALDPADTVPNKDLVVRWRVSGEQARAAVVAGGGAFALMLNPEVRGAQPTLTPKEVVFVIDTSCSMAGPPLAAAKAAMRLGLQRLGPSDTFMLIDFAEKARAYSEAPVLATAPEVQRALRYLDALPSGGATNQLAGIRKALGRPEEPGRLRMVLLMTDGYIGNEQQVFDETKRLLGSARVFGFGVGSSVNHFLLARLSEEGRGFYQYVRPDEDATRAVDRFVRRLQQPLITDVRIDWGALPVVDLLPAAVPDLFDAQPLIIHGRYRAAAKGSVVLRGQRGGLPVTFEVPVQLPDPAEGGRALSIAWARKRIEQLSRQPATPEVNEQLTSLGLEHHLVTKFTSLVAVDEVRVANGTTVTVVEPTLAPDLTREDAVMARPLGMLGIVGSGVGGGGAFDGLLAKGGGLKGIGSSDPAMLHGAASGFGTGAGRSAVGIGSLSTHMKVLSEPKVSSGRSVPAAPVKVVSGRIDRELVRALFEARRVQVEACVERQALLTPGLAGMLVLRLTIGADGRVTRVEVGSREHEQLSLTNCLAAVVTRWRFPANVAGPAQVLVPIRFGP